VINYNVLLLCSLRWVVETMQETVIHTYFIRF